ncbi:MAG: hypothetical protein HQ517_15400 [SAR324 cluster bacterium]|nr:hypothetical protein [SAR324 cluster bacterium]
MSGTNILIDPAHLLVAAVAFVSVVLTRNKEKRSLEERKLRLEIEVLKTTHGLEEPKVSKPATINGQQNWNWWALAAGVLPFILSIFTMILQRIAGNELVFDLTVQDWVLLSVQTLISVGVAYLSWNLMINLVSSRVSFFFTVLFITLFLQNTILIAIQRLIV